MTLPETIYYTRYALGDGILAFSRDEVTVDLNGYLSMQRGRAYFTAFKEGNDWHRTAEDAVAKAEQMRDKKIVYLTRKLAELKAMEFAL